jgi:uncharacterized protein (TIGR01777 family)
MKVALTGATGLVGEALLSCLTTNGHEVIRLAREHRAPSGAFARWDQDKGILDTEAVEGLDAVVHLAGESIVGRWTATKKRRIRDSRWLGTKSLSESVAKLKRKPRVLVCASAVGYYGDRGDEVLREDSGKGSGFLAEVCEGWETATELAARAGIRVVNLRIGVVLSNKGGALRKMLMPFRLGAGGVIGGGKQYWSWIDLNDLVGVILFAITHDNLRGPVNAVAPHAVTNREFTKTLGRVLARPTPFPMPAFGARMAFGEMADALFLASARVEPAKLLAAGYNFQFPTLEEALRNHLSGGSSQRSKVAWR